MFKCQMSNAQLDPCGMLNNFCFHVYAQKWHMRNVKCKILGTWPASLKPFLDIWTYACYQADVQYIWQRATLTDHQAAPPVKTGIHTICCASSPLQSTILGRWLYRWRLFGKPEVADELSAVSKKLSRFQSYSGIGPQTHKIKIIAKKTSRVTVG